MERRKKGAGEKQLAGFARTLFTNFIGSEPIFIKKLANGYNGACVALRATVRFGDQFSELIHKHRCWTLMATSYKKLALAVLAAFCKHVEQKYSTNLVCPQKKPAGR